MDTLDYLTTTTSGLHPQVQHQLVRIHSHPMRTLLIGLAAVYPQRLVYCWSQSSQMNKEQEEIGLDAA